MNHRMMNACGILLIMLTLSGCWERDDLAPVGELNWHSTNRHVLRHSVLRGETLYAIAFRYDTDYRTLAALNHLSYPYALRIGQIIQLKPTRQTYTPARRPPILPTYRYSQPITRKKSGWLWPARGRIVSNFIPQQGKKGLDIAGSRGQKIHASARGVVAYAGNGLSGYGNLIIIKHDNQFLTAYAHNAQNLVHEGQVIQAGQVIAEMGLVDRRYFGLHFEIRQAGKPVNPLNYLGR